MKKVNFKSFIAGVIIGGVMLSGIGYAASNLTSIEVNMEPISFKLNEQAISTSDKPNYVLSGTEYVPASFIYKGTTYVPVRFVGEAVGVNVEWEGSTRTVAMVDSTNTSTPVATSMSHKVIADTDATLPEEVKKWVSEHQETEYTGTINANGHTYILVARGQSPHPGYGLALIRIFSQESNIMVQAKYTEPDPDMSYPQVITYPTLLIEIDQTSKEVKFEISGKEQQKIQ